MLTATSISMASRTECRYQPHANSSSKLLIVIQQLITAVIVVRVILALSAGRALAFDWQRLASLRPLLAQYVGRLAAAYFEVHLLLIFASRLPRLHEHCPMQLHRVDDLELLDCWKLCAPSTLRDGNSLASSL